MMSLKIYNEFVCKKRKVYIFFKMSSDFTQAGCYKYVVLILFDREEGALFTLLIPPDKPMMLILRDHRFHPLRRATDLEEVRLGVHRRPLR